MVLILLATVITPLIVSAFLVQRAINTSLGLGLNDELAGQLRNSLEMHRLHIQDLKAGFAQCFEHISDSKRLIDVASTGNESEVRTIIGDFIKQNANLITVRLIKPNGEALVIEKNNSLQNSKDRTVSFDGNFSYGPFTSITTVFKADSSLEKDFVHAAEILNAYQALVSAPPNYLKNRFTAVYYAALSIAVAISIVVGITLSRRIVKRIHHLCDAVSQVAEGDLTVRVIPGANDEVGELAASFNNMVLELSQNKSRIEYLQKISAWQEIARRLAHEIKNPLTPIRLAAQQLEEKYKGNDPYFQSLLKQSVEIIKEEVETLRRLTADFAAFAKLPKLDPKEVNLADFLQECKSSTAGRVEELGVSIDFDIPKAKIKISIDRIMMKRVIDNLIQNAAEAIVHASVESPLIEVKAKTNRYRGKPEVIITVSDNGPGVPDELRQSIFDPYFTTKEEGTGLGLAISKKIVLEHGGQILLEEKQKTGALFSVILPAYRQS